ncbi:MAG TPA: carboxypeptidase-like regulatory domain-containing protein [Candidatus Acidoferrum sp.]|nr:carboxypeptidase-like regulatory domain-containing protein [Candidatus Acidoferrum sp.]
MVDRFKLQVSVCLTVLFCLFSFATRAQQTLGAINGTVTDASGGVVGGVNVQIRNVGTNLLVKAQTKNDGSFSVVELPIGTYELTFSKEGFQKDVYSQILVEGNRTTTVNSKLSPGTVSSTVVVEATPLMNQTDTTNGYVVDQTTIQDTPLGTGSFTQLAILSPGVHADFLGGSGSNSGLGNQAIFANGNRDTSNSFSLNGTNTNNLFNGNSTSQVGENRFVLNTGENFGAGGGIQTSTSVYGAIGQSLPTPPPDSIQEIDVNASMYDASQGNNSGAHISVTTKSGTNQLHGSAWEQFQNSDMNANYYFYNDAVNPVTGQGLPIPFLNRNQFGATLGGPIKKDKLFYFVSYQGIRLADQQSSQKDVTVLQSLTNDRSAQGIANAINDPTYGYDKKCSTGGTCFQASAVNPAALNLLNAKLPDGQYLIPTPQYSGGTAKTLGYNAVVTGPDSLAPVDQGIADIDYAVSNSDHLRGNCYIQNNPTYNPFGAVGSLLGFPQQLLAGSQVFSLTNTEILSPTLTWEQQFGFTRLRAYGSTQEGFTPAEMNISLLGSATFPQFDISKDDPTLGEGLEFGPSTSFANAGMYQNQWEYGSTLNLVKGKNTISAGFQLDHTQLNIINNNTNTDTVDFKTFLTFVEGQVSGGDAFEGAANRYYRSNTIGAFVNDEYKVRSNLTITAGLRWDFDGPLSEKYGKLTSFNPSAYAYTPCTIGGVAADPTTGATCDTGSDVITNSGLEVATPGDSLMNQRQWGVSPRIGIAWAPFTKLTVRAGYGIYYDRGELFSYLSPSAGAGFNGPFGVTLAPPFVEPIATPKNSNLSQPFGTTEPAAPPATAAGFLALLPNLQQTACGYPGCWPSGNVFGPFLFGGYDPNNKLPYTENWTLDLQYQLSNNWMFEVGYVGNRGIHEVLPVPFNQPLIATAQNPVNGQTSSYGGTSPYSYSADCSSNCLDNEPVYTNEYSGNAPTRVPYPGYDMNSVLYEAIGISDYNALQVQVHKRISHGFQLTGSYTWSHSLDEQSGAGLFVTGNNPLTPRDNYASSDFDQTHVFLVNYSYTTPDFAKGKLLGEAVNGWTIGGQTVAQSGQPYSVYDYTGSIASLYFGTDDEIGNPIVPLKAGVTPKEAELQGTLGVNANKGVLNPEDFEPVFVQPGTYGVPAPDASGSDDWESLYGTSGRNMFRGPFQVRFDMSLAKQFALTERFGLRFEADAFNMFNHPDFDTPNNDVEFFEDYEGPVLSTPLGELGQIQHTIGSPRFLQLALHLTF